MFNNYSLVNIYLELLIGKRTDENKSILEIQSYAWKWGRDMVQESVKVNRKGVIIWNRVHIPPPDGGIDFHVHSCSTSKVRDWGGYCELSV